MEQMEQMEQIKKMFLKLTNQKEIDDETFIFYKNVAVTMIERYLGIDEYFYINVEHCYEEQTVLLAAHVYNIHSNIVASTQNSGIESISSNGRSVSFASAEAIASQVGIPDYIKTMLPKPKSRVKVW